MVKKLNEEHCSHDAWEQCLFYFFYIIFFTIIYYYYIFFQ